MTPRRADQVEVVARAQAWPTRSGVRDRLLSEEVALPEGRVAVKLFAGVKAAFGRPEVSVEFGEGSDLHSVLLTACDTPARRRALFLDSGDLRPELQVLVNGRNVRFLDGLRTVLRSGDEVAVFPPMYGG